MHTRNRASIIYAILAWHGGEYSHYPRRCRQHGELPDRLPGVVGPTVTVTAAAEETSGVAIDVCTGGVL